MKKTKTKKLSNKEKKEWKKKRKENHSRERNSTKVELEHLPSKANRPLGREDPMANGAVSVILVPGQALLCWDQCFPLCLGWQQIPTPCPWALADGLYSSWNHTSLTRPLSLLQMIPAALPTQDAELCKSSTHSHTELGLSPSFPSITLTFPPSLYSFPSSIKKNTYWEPFMYWVSCQMLAEQWGLLKGSKCPALLKFSF